MRAKKQTRYSILDNRTFRVEQIKYFKKYFYRVKTSNVWGNDLKPEFPKKPDIIIHNNFKKSTAQLTSLLLSKIKKKLK